MEASWDIKKAADIVQTVAYDGCETDVVTYGTLTAGHCKASRVEVATELLRTIQMQAMVLNPVVQTIFRRKEIKRSCGTFQRNDREG
ncbi:hypothetical protein SADUNF_Sadunf11G0003400 [Salix dunnii]|uniref:Uncharacterized protein n=1 Tax=Salix dunnii TaxID=1413687 RepID=A0A835JP53_9ROSI|nr:hypothetical protein SADUNF_Sadunf11G0003400 [Salix dunnii]